MTPRRADLHVHTRHSRVSGNLRFLRSRDCYSRPADVYRVARRRGMDYVAFTDHDSIGGALELLEARPDLADRVIVGEEVSCTLPDGGVQVHLAVYGMTEALHRDLQPLRENVFDVIARLREADVFFALNHLLHFYRGQVPLTATSRSWTSSPPSKRATARWRWRTTRSSSASHQRGSGIVSAHLRGSGIVFVRSFTENDPRPPPPSGRALNGNDPRPPPPSR